MSLLRTGGTLQGKLRSVAAFGEKLRNFKTPERLKGTFLERWGQYWKGLYLDYRDVAVDISKQCRDRPIKAGVYLSGLAGCYYCGKTNPDMCSFRDDLLRNAIRLMYVGESTRNPVSMNHVLRMEECLNTNIVRRLSLGVISFIWLDNYSDQCALYKTTCGYLRPQYATFHERIVDVGFLGRWWVLQEKMKDYDVNNSEFN